MVSKEIVSQGGILIRQARLRAGLTQKDLAERLSTSQSLVARWEGGTVEPGFATVPRAVRACGLDLSFSIVAYDHEVDILIEENLKLTPTERLERMHYIRRQFEKLAPQKAPDVNPHGHDRPGASS